MKKKRFTEEQIIAVLKESEAGAATKELCRKHGISEPTFYNWKAKYAGMTVSEARRLKELAERYVDPLPKMAGQALEMESKVVMAFLLAMFPIFVNSVTGLGEVEPDIVDLARLSGGTPWRIFTHVRLYHAAPYIVDALKIAFPLALVGSIVGEFHTAPPAGA